MSSAIKHMGGGFANAVLTTTSEPFVALFIGILATVLFQSSSTTTSLIVGMVSSGSLGLNGAIPMIMGANIGTTVTAKIVSLGHITRKLEFRRAFAASSVHDTFNLITVAILLPLEYSFHILERMARYMGSAFVDVTGVTKPENYVKKATKPVIEWMGDALNSELWLLIVSVAITFFMLFAIVKLLQSLVLKKLESWFFCDLFSKAALPLGGGVCMRWLLHNSRGRREYVCRSRWAADE